MHVKPRRWRPSDTQSEILSDPAFRRRSQAVATASESTDEARSTEVKNARQSVIRASISTEFSVRTPYSTFCASARSASLYDSLLQEIRVVPAPRHFAINNPPFGGGAVLKCPHKSLVQIRSLQKKARNVASWASSSHDPLQVTTISRHFCSQVTPPTHLGLSN